MEPELEWLILFYTGCSSARYVGWFFVEPELAQRNHPTLEPEPQPEQEPEPEPELEPEPEPELEPEPEPE
eukprot:COSAG01_NODE_178_length_22933_cov_18.398529_14_plen_70_part_00